MRTQTIHHRIGAPLLGCIFATTLVGCGKEEIKVYSVPKEHFPAPATQMSQSDIPVHSAPSALRWETPDGWTELAPTGIRLGNLLVTEGEKRAEISIFSFPGNAGSELDNVNRWRGEIALEPITEKELTSEIVSVGKDTAQLYDLPGKEFQTIAVILPRGNASWFFKMRGDKEVVSKNKSKLLALLKSVQFEAGEAKKTAVASQIQESTPAKETRVSARVSAGPDGVQWDVPAGWKEAAATAMVLQNFSVGEGAREVKIAISRFPGDVGGTLANVNRWRSQLTLDSVDEAGLSKLITSIDVLGGKATFVDMKGTDSKTGQPARMVAASVPRDGQTWFYKMMGDDATVAREKDAFVKFVQSVRY